ncbi:MAG: tetratricopeptide repeat protein [Verrucomicrobiaceae bacterium]|nr:MAG: tetratricopeptide repeat protein [Verrucomicrobiaceae bacterium]
MKTLLILFAFLTLPASACIWVEGTNLHGEHRRTEGRFPDHYLHQALLIEPEDTLRHLLASRSPPQPGSISEKEFLGVKELLSGNHAQAITILLQLEDEHPGFYSTAANLGTAYELNGDLDSALKWIQEGVRRNQDSHQGSEWVHVEILRARIRLRENPRYLHEHRVIPMPESFTNKTTTSIGGHTYNPSEISRAIFYQLQERMIFVKPPDPVVADLILTLGQIEARISTVESAKRLLNMATDYGLTDPAFVPREINRYDEALASAKASKIIRITLWIILIVAAFTAFIAYAWKAKHFFLTGKAYHQHRATKARGAS